MLAIIVLLSATTPEQCRERFPARPPESAREYFNAFDQLFVDAGTARNVDPALLKAIAYCETRLDPCAVSPVGARGLLQFMPATFDYVASAAVAHDPFNPADSIRAGSLYVALLTNYWRGDLEAIVASYNAGPTAVMRARKRGRSIPAIDETIGYVACVTQTHAWLRRPLGAPRAEEPGLFSSITTLLGSLSR